MSPQAFLLLFFEAQRGDICPAAVHVEFLHIDILRFTGYASTL